MKKILLGFLVFMAPSLMKAATIRYVQISTASLNQQQGLMSVQKSSTSIALVGAFTSTNSITANAGSTVTFNGAFNLPAGSTTTENGNFAAPAGSTFSATSSSITIGVAGSTVTFGGAASISTVAVSGQLQMTDGNIRSSITNFVVGYASATLVSSTATTSSANFVLSNSSATITLKKSTDKVLLFAIGYMGNDTANDGCDLGFYRDSTFITGSNGTQRFRNPTASVVQQTPYSIIWPDAPGDTSSHVYSVGFRAVAGGTCTLNSVGTLINTLMFIEIGQ